jgi:hypothetical protein
MIKFRLTLSDGSRHFVAARSFREAIEILMLAVPCADFRRPREDVDREEIVSMDVWDTETCSRFECPMYLKKED